MAHCPTKKESLARMDAMQSARREKLRDKFAAAALTGLLASNSVNWGADAAEIAYQNADAMLAERDK